VLQAVLKCLQRNKVRVLMNVMAVETHTDKRLYNRRNSGKTGGLQLVLIIRCNM